LHELKKIARIGWREDALLAEHDHERAVLRCGFALLDRGFRVREHSHDGHRVGCA
jgi:hypothetical protein